MDLFGLTLTTRPYVGAPFYFCRSGQFYYSKQCDGETQYVPPKKAIIYNKPEHRLSKRELQKWYARNKYR
jgi:hypothetical protein